MKQLILISSLLLSVSLVPSSFAQTKKPPAAIAPLAAMGELEETQKQIIFNRLLDKLSVYYDLISNKRFLQAQDTAYETLEEQKCTEEQCIRKIQELLQVENLFILQIIREGQDTQLSLILIDLKKKIVKSAYCPGCDTQTLNERVATLVDRIREGQPPLPTPTPATEIVATNAVGKVFISSTPSGAEILLDGQPLDQQTDTLLEDLPAGKHALLLRKDNLARIQEFTVLPNKMTSLDIKLEPSQASLFVTSQPVKAEVLLDGKPLGQTPLDVDTAAGKHRLELRLEGFIPVSREVNVRFGEKNKLEVPLTDGRLRRGSLSLTTNVASASARLHGGAYVPTKLEAKLPLSKQTLPIGTYEITVTKAGYETVNRSVTLDTDQEISVDIPLSAAPATLEVLISRTEGVSSDDGVFQLLVNGKVETTGSAPTQAATAAYVLKLPEGQYQLEVRHTSGKYERLTKTMKLLKGQKYAETFVLQPNTVYLEHQVWKWQWGSAFAGTLVSLGLWYREETTIQNANKETLLLIDKMNDATTQKEAIAYHAQAAKQIEAAQRHQQNAKLSALLSAGMAGLAWWLWATEPPAPYPESTWNWQPGPQGELQLVYSKRW